MSDTSGFDTLFHGRIRAVSHRLFWFGLAMTILGVVALLFPVLSSLVAALLVGWVLIFAGGITLFAAFSMHGTGPFFGALLLGLLSFAAGVFLIANPLAGAIALTLMVGILFMMQGAFEVVFAFEMRPHTGWIGMLLSGLVSILMAVLIAAGWPGVSVIVLGVLLGVNFISTGLGYIFVSKMMKPAG